MKAIRFTKMVASGNDFVIIKIKKSLPSGRQEKSILRLRSGSMVSQVEPSILRLRSGLMVSEVEPSILRLRLRIDGERPSTSLGTSPESLDFARDGSRDGELVEPFIEGRSRTIKITY